MGGRDDLFTRKGQIGQFNADNAHTLQFPRKFQILEVS